MERRSGFKLSKLIVWWDGIERAVTRLLLLLFVMMVLTQCILVNKSLKTFLSSAEKLEGKSVSETRPSIKKGGVVLTIQGSSYIGNVDVFVNGEKVTSFYRSKVNLQIRNNDIIEISAVRSKNNYMVQVTEASENVVTPELGRTLNISGNLVTLCRVKLK